METTFMWCHGKEYKKNNLGAIRKAQLSASKLKNDSSPSRKGLILVFTGDGKGKTTAAFGTALRTVGSGGRVAIVQFFKSQKTSEWVPLLRLAPKCRLFRCGGGFTWKTSSKVNQKAADKAWRKCRALLRDPKYSLVIFDEIHIALKYKFIKTSDLIRGLRRKRPSQHVILTGRGAPESIVKLADLVTEMKCMKHPFQRGVFAKRGIDF